MSEDIGKVTLLVKNPFSKIDYSVRVPVEWDILQLKHHLKEFYPARPEITRQRLIYSGKLLQDSQNMQNIFGEVLKVFH
jgi:hypothetical protein